MYATAKRLTKCTRLTRSGICFGSNYTILHLDIPDNPAQPCLSCTKQWCLNQNLPICAGASLGDTDPDTATGKEGDVEARCFRACIEPCDVQALKADAAQERDSPRDQLVVTLFLLTVFGLLLGAGIKGRMQKAGIDVTMPWNSGRRWWEVSARHKTVVRHSPSPVPGLEPPAPSAAG